MMQSTGGGINRHTDRLLSQDAHFCQPDSPASANRSYYTYVPFVKGSWYILKAIRENLCSVAVANSLRESAFVHGNASECSVIWFDYFEYPASRNRSRFAALFQSLLVRSFK